jgi:hypothetical protein
MLFSFIRLVCSIIGGLVPFMINITHLRIKPLTLASGQRPRLLPLPLHNRYPGTPVRRTGTCVRWEMAVAYNRSAVNLYYNRFTSGAIT